MNENKIRIGGHQLSWGTTLKAEDIHPIAKKIKSLGCDAFELFLNGFGNAFPAATIRTVAAENKLSIIGCAVILPGVDGDPLSTRKATREKAEKKISDWVFNLNSVNSFLLVGPLFNVLGKKGAKEPTDLNLEAGLKTFRNIASYAYTKGVRIAIEPLKWTEMPWPNNVRQVLDFIKIIEEPANVPNGVFGVHFDIYHALRMEENWKKSLKRVLEADRLYHVHVAGPNRTPPRRNQHISWKRLINILKEFGWKGFITIESFGDECDLPFAVVGPGNRPPAEEVIATGVNTLRRSGLG